MTSIARSTLPLSGVRVVDFGQYIAGPAVAMILGDLGATVVHIDPQRAALGQSRQRHPQPQQADRRTRPQNGGGFA